MMALIAPFLPYILAALGVIGGVFGVAWGRKTSQTSAAKVAAAKSDATAQIATQQAAEAEANQTAAQSGAAAVQTRTEIDNTVAAKPADEVRNELQDWTKP